MELKHKVLGFTAESLAFTGAAKETEDTLLGSCIFIVQFGDKCKYTAVAREKTEKVLSDCEAYKILSGMTMTRLGNPRDMQYFQAHKTRTSMFSILFHRFLIQELQQDGYTVLQTPDNYLQDIDTTKCITIE